MAENTNPNGIKKAPRFVSNSRQIQDAFNELSDYLDEVLGGNTTGGGIGGGKIQPGPSANVFVYEDGKGNFTLDARGGEDGVSAPPHAYRVIDASSQSGPAVTVTPGSHNGIVPTINGTPISDVDPAPILTLGAAVKIIYIELNLNVDTAFIESCSINSSNEITVPEGDATTVYQIIAFATFSAESGLTLNQNVSGSQAYQACGGTNLFGLI